MVASGLSRRYEAFPNSSCVPPRLFFPFLSVFGRSFVSHSKRLYFIYGVACLTLPVHQFLSSCCIPFCYSITFMTRSHTPYYFRVPIFYLPTRQCSSSCCSSSSYSIPCMVRSHIHCCIHGLPESSSLIQRFSSSSPIPSSYLISSMTCPRMQLSLLIFTSFSLLSSLLCHFVFLRSPLIGCLPKGIHHLSRLDLVVLTGGLMRLTVQPIRRLLHAPAVYLSVWLFIRLPLSVCLPVHLVLCVSVFTCLCLFHSTFHGEFSGQSKLSHGEQILSWSYLTFLRSCFFIFFFYPHHIIFLSRRGVLV